MRKQLELLGNPVLWPACLAAVSVVKDQHNFPVAHLGNFVQLPCRHMLGASSPSYIDTCIGVEEKVLPYIRFDVPYHSLSRKRSLMHFPGQYRIFGQPQELRIAGEVKITTSFSTANAAEQHRMDNPFIWPRDRVQQAAVGILESIAEEFCVSHMCDPHPLKLRDPRRFVTDPITAVR